MVKVLSGNYRGATGQVTRTIPSKGLVVVEGVNMRKHHKRPSASSTGEVQEGGIFTYEAPIHVSNVMLVCPRSATNLPAYTDGMTPTARSSASASRCGNPIPTAG